MEDDLPNASLFKVELVPRWSQKVVHFLISASLDELKQELCVKAEFIEACHNFILLFGRLYYLAMTTL